MDDPFILNTSWWVRLAVVCAVIAGVSLGAAEWPKRLIKQRAASLWNGEPGKAAKVGLLGVFLLPVGGVLGALLLPAAQVTTNPTLALGLGAGCAMFAAPLYDAGTMLIGLIPKFAAKQAGVTTTSSTPAVENPPPPAG